MKTSSSKQLLTLACPALFPLLKLSKGDRSADSIMLTILFVMNWLLYISVINHYVLAMLLSSIVMLFLLIGNPYWCFDLDECFSGESRKSFDSVFVRIGIVFVLFYSAPPAIAEMIDLIVRTFFLSDVMLSSKEITAKYISWTTYHKIAAWLILIGYSILQFRPIIKLGFYEFFFNQSPCQDNRYQFNALGALYFFGMYIVLAIFATVLSLRHGISLIW